MALADLVPLVVGLLLMFFVMSVVPVHKVLELADLVLDVDCLDLDVVEMGIFLVSNHVDRESRGRERGTFQLVLELLGERSVALVFVSTRRGHRG